MISLQKMLLASVALYVGVQMTYTNYRKGLEIEEKNQMITMLTNKLSCLTNGVLPSGGFCLEQSSVIIGGNNVWDGKLCAGLEDIFGYSSVVDLGAGLGHYGYCFLRLNGSGIQTTNKEQAQLLADNYKQQMTLANLLNKTKVIRSWEGYDGSFNIEDVTGGKVHWADIGKPLDLGHQYDWVMSLEVGEHIPSEMEKYFLDNLVNHACIGVVLSWAVIGQGGHHHVNNHPNEYIRDQMSLRGLTQDIEAQKHLREMVTIPWFKDTIMVYRFTRKC